MPRQISTFLMFDGKAEEAMRFYAAVFNGSEICSIEKYGDGEMGAKGSVKHATFKLAGHAMACIDSPTKHAFTFTPSTSLFVQCNDEAELDQAFAALSEGGSVLMPLGNYGFSAKFVWLCDRFGVSWQLNLEESL